MKNEAYLYSARGGTLTLLLLRRVAFEGGSSSLVASGLSVRLVATASMNASLFSCYNTAHGRET